MTSFFFFILLANGVNSYPFRGSLLTDYQGYNSKDLYFVGEKEKKAMLQQFFNKK